MAARKKPAKKKKRDAGLITPAEARRRLKSHPELLKAKPQRKLGAKRAGKGRRGKLWGKPFEKGNDHRFENGNPGGPGRPSSYKPEYAEQARKLCEMGHIDKELALFFEVAINTIENWRARHPEFAEAMKIGKEPANDRVKRSLYVLANGYSYDAVKIFLDKDGGLIYAPYVEHVPPNVTAQIYWLKNRLPAEWRDIWRHELSIKGPVPIIHGGMTIEQAAEAYAATLSGGEPALALPAPETVETT